jgi:hypothetical protein
MVAGESPLPVSECSLKSSDLSLREDILSMPVVPLVLLRFWAEGSMSQNAACIEGFCLSADAQAGPYRLSTVAKDMRSRKLRSLRLAMKQAFESAQMRY